MRSKRSPHGDVAVLLTLWLPNHTSWRVERLEGKEMEEESIPSGMKAAFKGLEDSLRHHLEKEIAPGIQRTLDSFRQELEKIKSEIQQQPQRNDDESIFFRETETKAS